MSTSSDRHDLFPGALKMMVLQTLRLGPLHGYALAQAIRRASDDLVHVEEGSLYPALQAMVRRGWLKAEWRASENNRRARYYRVTAEGRKQLEVEIDEWYRASAAVNRVLRHAFAES